MEAVLLIGMQASGKSTFFQQRFFATHVRINLDMLKTRHREHRLIETCLETRQPFVVDNTNPTRADRQPYLEAATAAGFRKVGYYFQSRLEDCLRRNRERPEERQIPLPGLLETYGKLQLPSLSEGFDELRDVRIAEAGGFAIEEWTDEVR